MQSISLWATVFAITKGAKLLDVEDLGDLVRFTLSDDAEKHIRAYEVGKCVVNLRDAVRARHEVTLAIKAARRQPIR
jgi:hypothetical protein